jgi:DNA-binding MarR family transcriptional regulator
MNYEWQIDLSARSRTAAATLPPPLIEETAWDILLALHSDDGSNLSLDKLASIVSVPQPVLNQWLGLLEERQLITGANDGVAQQLRAVLTPAGRELLDRYLSVTSDLQIGAHH